MNETSKILASSQWQTDVPSIIIDKLGNIIALNPEIKKIISGASPKENFFELFEIDQINALQKIFNECRSSLRTSKDVVELSVEEVYHKIEFSFTPLKSDNNIYFTIGLKQYQETKTETLSQKFVVASNEIEKVTADKHILSVINKIKLTFPFTFIEKAKIQKEINELDDFFWIKEPNGKLILVNESYAASLGFSANQLENKPEQDFLPKYLINLYQIVDKYILETTNSIILDSIASPVTSGSRKGVKVVVFPMCDLEGHVVALIGFSQRSLIEHENQDADINSSFYKELLQPVIVVDTQGKIRAYSNEFTTLIVTSKDESLIDKNFSEIFDKEFVEKTNKFLADSTIKEDLNFNYIFSEHGKNKADVIVRKIYDIDENLLGAQLSFTRKNDLQIQLESKAQLYDTVLHHGPEAIFIYDLDNLKFLDVNNAALKLYGYKRNDFLNMDLTDLYAPEDIQTLIQSGDNKALNIGPWRHKKHDGSSILVELTRTSIDFQNKKAHLNIVKNVTNEIEEKKWNQHLQIAYENSSELILNTDKDGIITDINELVSKKIGYSKKELVTRPFVSLVSDDERGKVNKNIFHSGLLKTSSLELEIKKPSGALIKTTVIASPIKNYNGEVDSYILIIRPIEEKVEAKDLKHTQEEIMENVDPPFLSNMFHEILTPINVVLGFTQELWESLGSPTDEQKEAVEIIKENQKLLLQIMDNAVEYSTLQQKVVKFKPEDFKFVDILEELKENSKKVSESKKVELSYGKISSSLTFESDKQKFISLISLFIKFGLQITKENNINLSAYNYDDKNFVISIKDTKTVISQYLYKGINDVFADEETSSRRNYGFSRFSIRLAKKLLELLSGTKVAIKKGEEVLEFGLLFPLKFVINEKVKVKVETIKSTPSDQKQVQQIIEKAKLQRRQIDLTQLSCLYLEDQVDSQILFKNQMKDLKSIEFAPSLELAMPLLKTKRFDFILMDINLQGEYNGLDALRIIKKMPGFQSMPIIASTAYMQPGARENYIAAGFDNFIPKPLLRDKVIEILSQSLR